MKWDIAIFAEISGLPAFEAISFNPDGLESPDPHRIDIEVLWESIPAFERVSTGFIFISPAMASHGPRVKFYRKTAKGPSFSMTIENEPKIVASSGFRLKERNRFEPLVREWIVKNKDDLLYFWFNGHSLTTEEKEEVYFRLTNHIS